MIGEIENGEHAGRYCIFYPEPKAERFQSFCRDFKVVTSLVRDGFNADGQRWSQVVFITDEQGPTLDELGAVVDAFKKRERRGDHN